MTDERCPGCKMNADSKSRYAKVYYDVCGDPFHATPAAKPDGPCKACGGSGCKACDARKLQPVADAAQDQDGLVGECRTAISDLESILVHGDPEVDNALEVFERAAAEIEALLKVGMKLNKRAVKAERERDELREERDECLDLATKMRTERDELRRKLNLSIGRNAKYASALERIGKLDCDGTEYRESHTTEEWCAAVASRALEKGGE